MKNKIFALLYFIHFTFIATAQTSIYHPFPDSNATWTCSYIQPSGPIHGEGYTYLIQGDTTINTLSYHKLYIPFVDIVLDTMGTIHYAGYQGCIRHDGLNKKVYYILPNDTIEKILYDFNLNVGDAYTGSGRYFIPLNDTVQAIDSILIGNTYRKQWIIGRLMFPTSGYTLIEGIGYDGGLLETTAGQALDGPRVLLNCFSQDNHTLYPDTTFPCEIVDRIQNFPDLKSRVTIFPNPFHSTTFINLYSESKSTRLSIYNVLGIRLREVLLNSGSSILNRDGLQNGIYFFQLVNDNGQTFTNKVAVE